MTLFGMQVSWIVFWAGYLAAGVWFGIVKQWPLRAGLAMMFFVLLPMFSRDLYWAGQEASGLFLCTGRSLL